MFLKEILHFLYNFYIILVFMIYTYKTIKKELKNKIL